jgi:hypothetical protein
VPHKKEKKIYRCAGAIYSWGVECLFRCVKTLALSPAKKKENEEKRREERKEKKRVTKNIFRSI